MTECDDDIYLEYKDAITGRKIKKPLNQKKISREQLDEIFLDEDMLYVGG